MSLALVKTAKSISPQRLQDPHVDVSIVMMQKRFATYVDEAAKLVDVEVEQFLAKFRRQIGLGIIEKGSDVILECAFAAALIIQKKRLPALQHDISRLESRGRESNRNSRLRENWSSCRSHLRALAR